MHTHMFNARYLPLKGIFRSYEVPNIFVTPLARFCWFLTRYSDFNLTPRTPLLQFVEPEKYKQHHKPDVKKKMIEGYIEAMAKDCTTLVNECLDLNNVVFQSSLEENDSSENCIVFSPTEKAATLLVSSILDAYDKSMPLALPIKSEIRGGQKTYTFNKTNLKDLFKNFLSYAFQSVEHIVDTLDFAWNLTHSEIEIYNRLRAYYADVVNDSTLVHFMMDMAEPFNKNSKYPNDGHTPIAYYKDKNGSQLSRMKGLFEYAQNQLIGFSAFDPIRFLKNQSDREEIIAHLDGAKSYGLLGFKFYPPLGYRPAENEDERLNNIVDIFLDYCVKTGTPVFTHCTPGGFKLSKNSKKGLNSDPSFWKTALEKTGRKKLRLCLGHAGGGIYDVTPDKKNTTVKEMSYGWLSTEVQWKLSTNYAKKVAHLCREFPNVYCELANIDVIIEDKRLRENMRENLIRELNSPVGTYPLHNKIMYGTDWHMVGMVNDAVSYYQRLLEIFNDDALIGYFDKFFYGNAKRYLNLL